MNYHPDLYPLVGIDHHDDGDPQTEDELWAGPAPPSPFVVHTSPFTVGGQVTPPPSPPRHVDATQSLDPHAPCPATPQFVPSSVDFNEIQWMNMSNVGNPVAGPSGYGPISNSSGQGVFMPLGELEHYTSFAAPAAYGPSNDFDYTAQYGVPAIGGNDYLGFELLYQASLLQAQTTPLPNPVMMILKRAQLDEDGYEDYPVTTIACCDPPRGIFDMTQGRPGLTGHSAVDNQTRDFYSIRPHRRETDAYRSCYYSRETIVELQISLEYDWNSVFPDPIPPVLISLKDFIGPYNLRPKKDGFAYVVPAEDTLWGTILERGINSKYRTMANPDSVFISNDPYIEGSAIYHPEHIAASQFAVNLFVDVPTETGHKATTEYLGAYILKVADDRRMDRRDWKAVAPEVQQMVFDRAPHLFQGFEPLSKARPALPLVEFIFYKWDENVVGLADSIDLELKLRPAEDVDEDVDLEDEEGEYDYEYDDYYSEGTHTDTDSGFDTDSGSEAEVEAQLTPDTAYSPGPEKPMPFEDWLARQMSSAF